MPDNHHKNLPIRVLLVEDDPVDANLFQTMLAESSFYQYDVRHEDRLAGAVSHLAKRSPDVVLLDLSLPESKGLNTLKRVVMVAPQIPIVVLTRTNDEDTGITAVREGAQDYLVKGQVDPVGLSRAVHYAIERKRIGQELANTNRQLKKLDRLKNEFMSILSHDLRTPVSSMVAASETILGGYLGEVSDKQNDVIGVIKRKGDWLMRMLNDLLDLSRIEAGVFMGETEEIDLREPLRFAADQIDLNNVELAIDLPEDPVLIQGDRDRLVQAVQNLLTNAARFAKTRVRLHLAVNYDKVHIVVEDDGPGIPEAEQERIFHRYARAKVHTNKSQTGLGLAIVRAIVDGHLGTVQARNYTDEKTKRSGARFVVSLPIVPEFKDQGGDA